MQLPNNCLGQHEICDIISYPLFADADTGIYPQAASQYHARPASHAQTIFVTF